MSQSVIHPEHPYHISIDVSEFDFERVHNWLSDQAYWSEGIPLETCIKSFKNSLCYGLFHHDMGQVGCARMISDEATFAYLADVYIDHSHRGLGLGYWLVEIIMNDERLQGLRRMMLATSNMHELYKKFGFSALKQPDILMELTKPDIYQSSKISMDLCG